MTSIYSGKQATTRNILSAFALVAILAGCSGVGSDSGSSDAITEAPCSESTKTFSTAGAVQPDLRLQDLPFGDYVHRNTETYVEDRPTTQSTSRVHFLERQSGTVAAPTYVTGRRCRETRGTFVIYSTQVAATTSLRANLNGFFDVSTRLYNIEFATATAPKMTVGLGGDLFDVSVGTLASQISSYWNGGYRFARRSGEIYEFHGVRSEAGRTIYGKVVYERRALPPGSN